MQTLDYQEQIIFSLRALYDRYGYLPYKMNKFEEYDLYAKNKDFLISDSIITFTDLDGKLMALKPDVTLSIVKNTAASSRALQKLYYNENVYRVSKNTHAFREIMQVGLECLGDIDDYCISEVLLLAAKSLQTISPACVLDVSHLGLMSELLRAMGLPGEQLSRAFAAIGQKNFHELETLCQENGVCPESICLLQQLLQLSGSLHQALPRLRSLLSDFSELSFFARFDRILSALAREDVADVLRIDFSVVDDVHYYNGVVFKGFIRGVPCSVLSGGQYDKLMKKMHRSCGAIGFAVYTDLLERLDGSSPDYDVDTLLLYPQDAPLCAVTEQVRELTEQGISVLAVSRLPEDLRYRQLLRLEVAGHANHA